MSSGVFRRRQPGPNQPLRTNAGHPLAKGLGFFGWSIGTNRVWDALTGRVIDLSTAGSATGTFLRGAGDNGPTLRMSGGERGGGAIRNLTGTTLDQGTLVARFRPAQAIAAGVTRPYVLIGNTSLNRGLLLGMSGDTSSHAYGFSSSNGWILAGGNGVDEAVWRTVGVTSDPTDSNYALGYLEGAYHGRAFVSGAGVAGNVSSRIWFGRDNVGYFGYPTGEVGWVGYWHRLLGVGEHRLLHGDPWSLVQPLSLVQGWRFAAAATGQSASLTPGFDSLVITGYAPSVSAEQSASLTPGLDTLVITGYAPSVSTGQGASLTPGAGVLTITGHAPSVVASQNHNLTPGLDALAITGYAPAVSVGQNADLAPGHDALVITGYAPSVSAEQNAFLTPGFGALVITGYAPGVSNDINPAAGVGALVITGYAPVVSTATARQGCISFIEHPSGDFSMSEYPQAVFAFSEDAPRLTVSSL